MDDYSGTSNGPRRLLHRGDEASSRSAAPATAGWKRRHHGDNSVSSPSKRPTSNGASVPLIALDDDEPMTTSSALAIESVLL
ncbi:hypothetical protein AAVH_36953, partial [Aphelenchoides avenae]